MHVELGRLLADQNLCHLVALFTVNVSALAFGDFADQRLFPNLAVMRMLVILCRFRTDKRDRLFSPAGLCVNMAGAFLLRTDQQPLLFVAGLRMYVERDFRKLTG